ncbi:MAG TPA: DUF1573 domain-containing protein [Lacunisphaera sp.]|nr:DUF1573 domain-containing protein [Lacunisphaera sp.]
MNLALRSLRLLLGLQILLPTLGFGALSWDSQKIQLTAKTGEKQASGVFHFTNAGSATITITSVVPSCGCTTAELARRTYAPGETGEIKATITMGDMMGVQEKTITVTTDEAAGKPVPLILRVTIPELFTCTPQTLLWRIGDKLEEKSALISATEAQRIAAIEVKAVVSGEVSAHVEPVEAGTKFRLLVRPASTSKIMTAGISCIVRFADGMTLPFTVNALVR